jgi:hypothetical protein
MKKLLIISILMVNFCYGQTTPMLINGHNHTGSGVVVAQFNFARTSNAGNVPGWVDVLGFPLTAVRTATDSRSGNGITISSVNTAYWANITTVNITASDSGGATVANPTFVFPAGVALGWWGNGLTTYTAGQECLQISGLDATKPYRIEFLGSRTTGMASRRCVYYVVDANGTATDTLDVKNNTANLAIINGRVPMAGGTLKLHMKRDASDANNTWGAYLNGLRVIQEPN